MDLIDEVITEIAGLNFIYCLLVKIDKQDIENEAHII